MNKCPHCGALAGIEPSAALRWRCAVCGGPLVPTEDDLARSHRELPDLVRSHRSRSIALGWLAASFVLGSIAAMAVGTALLVWLVSHVAALVLAAAAGLVAVFAAVSLRRSRQRRSQARVELESAWELVAGEVVAARKTDTTAGDLARVMRTDIAHAEALLGSLSAHGRARVDVRDDAELAYTASDSEDAGQPDTAPSAASRPLRAP